MVDKCDCGGREKLQKTVRLLKELDEKYKKVAADRAVLLAFLKSVLTPSAETAAQLEAPPGQADCEKLRSLYTRQLQSFLEPERLKVRTLADENVVLRENERTLKLRLPECLGKVEKLESDLRLHAKQQVNTEANALLAKLRSVSHPTKPDPQDAKVREQADIITALKAQMAELQLKQRSVQSDSEEKPVRGSRKDSEAQTHTIEPSAESKLKAELEAAQRRVSELQFEFSVTHSLL